MNSPANSTAAPRAASVAVDKNALIDLIDAISPNRSRIECLAAAARGEKNNGFEVIANDIADNLQTIIRSVQQMIGEPEGGDE